MAIRNIYRMIYDPDIFIIDKDEDGNLYLIMHVYDFMQELKTSNYTDLGYQPQRSAFFKWITDGKNHVYINNPITNNERCFRVHEQYNPGSPIPSLISYKMNRTKEVCHDFDVFLYIITTKYSTFVKTFHDKLPEYIQNQADVSVPTDKLFEDEQRPVSVYVPSVPQPPTSPNISDIENEEPKRKKMFDDLREWITKNVNIMHTRELEDTIMKS